MAENKLVEFPTGHTAEFPSDMPEDQMHEIAGQMHDALSAPSRIEVQEEPFHLPDIHPTIPIYNPFPTHAALERAGELYKEAIPTYLDRNNRTEFSFLLNGDGNPGRIESSHAHLKNRMKIWPDTTAIVHTHPVGADPTPSPEDVDVTKDPKHPLQNFVMSPDQLWVAPGGKEKPRSLGTVKYTNGDLVITPPQTKQ